MRPEIQASKPASALRSGATLRMPQQARGIGIPEHALGIGGRDGGFLGLDHPEVGQAQALGQEVAVAERLAEELAGIEEDHGKAAVDLRRHLQQHRRLGAEGGDQRDAAGEFAFQEGAEQIRPIQLAIALGQISQALGALGLGHLALRMEQLRGQPPPRFSCTCRAPAS